MPKSYPLIASFNGGEVSALLEGRADIPKYNKLLKKCENFLVTPQGPAINRPGFKYIADTKNGATEKSRLVPFRFSTTTNYILEFGTSYIRFFRDGGQVQDPDTNQALLIHANETDATAGTSIVDSSGGTTKTITAVGDAQTDEDQKKFGNASLLFGGASDYLTTPDHADFDWSDENYLIDAWVRPTIGHTTDMTVFSQRTDASNWLRLYLGSNTSLMLRGDGVDGSSAITDTSVQGHTVTVTNDVEIDTSQSKFGGASMLFGGNGDNLLIADDNSLNVSNDLFTISMWIRLADVSTENVLFSQRTTDDTNRIYLRVTTNSTVRFSVANSSVGGAQAIESTSTLSLNTWHHVEVGGDGSKFYLFVDGNLENTGGTAITHTVQDYTGSFHIGAVAGTPGTKSLNGWMDDFRFFKGTAIHTATFIKPTSRHKVLHPVFETRIGASTESLTPDTPYDETIDHDAWGHIQIDADGTLHYLYADGVLQNTGGTNMTNTVGNFTQIVHIGGHHNNAAVVDLFKGWIDELRVMKVGDKTATFIPETTEYGTAGASALELTTNVDYAEADLFQLQFAQSADVLYIAHQNYPPRKLIRITDTSWALHDIEFFPAPARRITFNPGVAATLANKTVGDSALPRTITATGVFTAGDVGRLVREKDGFGTGEGLIKSVTPANSATLDIYKEFSSTSLGVNEWEIIGSSTTATLTVPSATVEFGDVITGTTSQAVFVASDVGRFITAEATDGTDVITTYYKILSITSSTIAVMVAIRNADLNGIPVDQRGVKVTGKSWHWKVVYTSAIFAVGDWFMSEPMWTSALGYPGSVTFFENRLLWAGSTTFPQTIWGSVVDDYENHVGGTNDSDAYQFTLAGREVNAIQWMVEGENLLVGTAGSEWSVGSRSSDAPVTPTNVSARTQTRHGSKKIMPVKLGQIVVYAQLGGEKIREMAFTIDSETYESNDLTILSDKIAKQGVNQLDFQSRPFSTVWSIRADGTLIGLTLMKEQEVIAWHRHTTGLSGEFQSVAVIPGELEDETWCIVKRTVNGSTKRFVERMETVFDDDDITSNSFLFMDAGIKYDGAPTTSITGLDHLDGEAVTVIGDGLLQSATPTVSSGTITITEASKVAVGIFTNAILQIMRLEGGSADGTSQSRTKRITNVGVRFHKTYNALMGPSETETDRIEFTAGEIFSGDKDGEDYDAGYETDGNITIIQDRPFPMRLLALIPQADTKGL